jgi:phosphoribosylanthranilate isomerase
MSKPLVKICGITRAEDAALALEAGADAIGLNFFRGPRKIDYQRVRDLALPAGLLVVGLASYPAAGDRSVDQIAAATGISTFQLYSDDYPAAGTHGALRVWLVASVDDRESLRNLGGVLWTLHWKPDAVLLDSRVGGQIGGTGVRFNWNWIAEARDAGELVDFPRIILAGGLTPENVAEAVRIVRPWAVDVSSGVEVAGKPGIKDAAKVRDFVSAVKGAA